MWCAEARERAGTSAECAAQCVQYVLNSVPSTWVISAKRRTSFVPAASFFASLSVAKPAQFWPSRRRDSHFNDNPCFIPVETPTKGRRGVQQKDSLADG